MGAPRALPGIKKSLVCAVAAGSVPKTETQTRDRVSLFGQLGGKFSKPGSTARPFGGAGGLDGHIRSPARGELRVCGFVCVSLGLGARGWHRNKDMAPGQRA